MNLSVAIAGGKAKARSRTMLHLRGLRKLAVVNVPAEGLRIDLGRRRAGKA